MKLAVIETGGKQYRVSSGQIIKIEKLSGEHVKGDAITFDKVLLLDDGAALKVGAPYVAGVRVEGEFVEEGRDKKIEVFKYKAKTRSRKMYGHRQPFVRVKIK